MSGWQYWNYEAGEISEHLSEPFILKCPSETDLWDKPPSTHSSNAPCVLKSTTKGRFVSAKVTVTADWVQKYDQGGLVLLISQGSDLTRWVKTGIEFLNGQPHVSTVATYKWSDWSLRPTASLHSRSATIELESNEDGSLWVYLLDEKTQRMPLREVTWWGDVDKDAEVSVGVYAAKPDKDPKVLEVSFEGIEINIR